MQTTPCANAAEFFAQLAPVAKLTAEGWAESYCRRPEFAAWLTRAHRQTWANATRSLAAPSHAEVAREVVARLCGVTHLGELTDTALFRERAVMPFQARLH